MHELEENDERFYNEEQDESILNHEPQDAEETTAVEGEGDSTAQPDDGAEHTKEETLSEEASESDKKAYSVYKELYPDSEISEKGAFEKFVESYHALHEKNQTHEADAKAIADVLESDPQFADVISAVVDGVPFTKALATYIDLDSLKPIEGDEEYEEYVKAADKRKAALAEKRKAEEEIAKNTEETQRVSEEFFAEKEMDKSAQDNFVDFVDSILKDVSEGKITRETLQKLHHAYSYEQDIKSARQAGETAGRNQKIETKRKSVKQGSDGLPNAGTSVENPNPTHEKSGVFGWLDDESEFYNN